MPHNNPFDAQRPPVHRAADSPSASPRRVHQYARASRMKVVNRPSIIAQNDKFACLIPAYMGVARQSLRLHSCRSRGSCSTPRFRTHALDELPFRLVRPRPARPREDGGDGGSSQRIAVSRLLCIDMGAFQRTSRRAALARALSPSVVAARYASSDGSWPNLAAISPPHRAVYAAPTALSSGDSCVAAVTL